MSSKRPRLDADVSAATSPPDTPAWAHSLQAQLAALATELAASRMENLIGDEAADWQRYLIDPTARLHLYGKGESRPGRKMGHVTFVTPLWAAPTSTT